MTLPPRHPIDRRTVLSRLLPLGCAPWLLSRLSGCSTVEPVTPFRTGTPPPAPYRNGAVAADHPIASEIGVEVLRDGGNAIDAAIAVNAALGVVRPYSCGLGGGGFLVVYTQRTKTAWAMNARETAPPGIWESYYTDLRSSGGAPEPASRYGGHAIAVPGTPAGLFRAHRQGGSLPMERLLAPAARVARTGYQPDGNYLGAVETVRSIRERYPWTKTVSQWVWETWCGEGTLTRESTVENHALADTLDRLGREGLDAWRTGSIPRSLAQAARASGGTLSAEAIAEYRTTTPPPLVVEDRFLGETIITMPPPSSGGIAIAQILGMQEQLRAAAGWPSLEAPEASHLLIESMKQAFALRAAYLADPAFAPVPTDRLLEDALVDQLVEAIDAERARPAEEIGDALQLPEDEGTSHLSVIDRERTAVAWTSTINSTFGSLVGDPHSGIVLNNEMDDFTTIQGEENLYGLRQSDWNLPQPGKRPLSSMSPTILVGSDGAVTAIAGGSGGPRIISATLQVLLGMRYQGLDATTAIARPRVHHQWMPDRVRHEQRPEGTTWAEALDARGQTLESGHRSVAVVQAIRVEPDGFDPASDPRKEGRAAGY
ncbi:MAG: gamma-glutamyltransferase [Planctomycetota bacterium]|nr:gamma-glutamyltransferase [Planctomycetota bacterium]